MFIRYSPAIEAEFVPNYLLQAYLPKIRALRVHTFGSVLASGVIPPGGAS